MVQKTPNLKGRTIAITRPAGQTEEAGKLICEMGAIPYYIPAIEIKGLINPLPLKKFIGEMQEGLVDYVIFMSTNGIKYLFCAAQTLKMTNLLLEGLKKSFIIAVGPKTAEALKEYQTHVDLVPQKYSSEGLLEALQDTEVKGKKIRIPRTSNATPTLTDKLRERGADVEEIYVYESGLPADEQKKNKFHYDLTSGRIDAVVFGSGLSAKNIFKMLSEKTHPDQLRDAFKRKVTTVAIGPTTAEALKEIGIQVDVTPQDYLFEKALTALAEFWSKKSA